MVHAPTRTRSPSASGTAVCGAIGAGSSLTSCRSSIRDRARRRPPSPRRSSTACRRETPGSTGPPARSISGRCFVRLPRLRPIRSRRRRGRSAAPVIGRERHAGDREAVELRTVGGDDRLPSVRRWRRRPEEVEAAALAVAVVAGARGAADGARLPARGRRGVGLLDVRRLCGRDGGRTDRSSRSPARLMTARADDRHVAPDPTRTVIVERVSSDISSTSRRRGGAGPFRSPASSTSTTAWSSFIVPSLPLSAASLTARPSLNVAVATSPSLRASSPSWMHVGELGLPGVVRDLSVDLRRQLPVVGPDRLDRALRRALVLALDQADPRRRASRRRPRGRHLDADVVVARLLAPGRRSDSRRCSGSDRTLRPVRSSIVGATWRTNATLAPCGRPAAAARRCPSPCPSPSASARGSPPACPRAWR